MNKIFDKPSENLFRSEAVLSQVGNNRTCRVKIRPLNILYMIGASFTSTALVILFLIFGEYTDRVTVAGVTQSDKGISRVYASKSGYIVGLMVQDGSYVPQGTTLLSIASDNNTLLGGTQENILVQLRRKRTELIQEIDRYRERSAAEKLSLDRQSEYLKQEIAGIDIQISQYLTYIEEMHQAYKNYKLYAQQGYVGKRELLDRYEIYQSVIKDHEDLKKERLQASRRLDELELNISTFDSKSKSFISEINRQILTIDEEILTSEALREVKISAPITGTVTSIIFHQGQYVHIGTQLMSIVPKSSDFEIQLFPKSSQIGFLKTGTKVSLRYASYPYQKFGVYHGTIISISRAPVNDGFPVLVDNENQQTEQNPRFLVIVKPDVNHVTAYGQHKTLWSGMAVEADIQLEKRQLYEWLLEPLLGFRGL